MGELSGLPGTDGKAREVTAFFRSVTGGAKKIKRRHCDMRRWVEWSNQPLA